MGEVLSLFRWQNDKTSKIYNLFPLLRHSRENVVLVVVLVSLEYEGL